MTEQTRASARCQECNALYHVPEADGTYRCKACGGEVRAAGARESAIGSTVTCPDCKAINANGAHFCAECGVVLAHSRRVSDGEEATRLRQEAASTLRRAYRWIDGVTWLYRVGALAYAVAAAFAVGALARTDVPVEGGVLVVVLTTLLSVLMLMGSLHILFKPFVWTVLIALLATLASVVHLVGPNPLGLAFLASASWAAVAWAALLPTFRFRRLIREHTDLYILHHAGKQTRRSLKGHFAKERHERLLTAMHRAAKRAWRISTTVAAAVCIASGLGTYAVVSSMRPEVFSTVLEDFESAWNDVGLPAVERFFDPEVRAAETSRLAGLTDGHGWGDRLPRLEDGRVRKEGERAHIDYELDGVALSVSWFLDGQTWRLLRIELPVPPFEPVLERFLAAWRRSDPRSLAEFFSPDKQVEMTDSIGEAALARGWERFPNIDDVVQGDYAAGDVTVVLDLERGKVRTEWRLRADGTWGLNSLRFPRRWAKR